MSHLGVTEANSASDYLFPPLLPTFQVSRELFATPHANIVKAGTRSSPPPSGSGSSASPGSAPNSGPQSDEQTSGVFEEEQASALLQCQDRLKRLNELNKVLENLADPSWSNSENRHLLAERLRKNKYFPAIQMAMAEYHHSFLLSNRNQLQKTLEPSADLGLTQRVRWCGTEAENELRQIRTLEQLSMQTLRSMMTTVSAEVPLCEEEVNAAALAAKRAYSPAMQAFGRVVDKSIAEDKPMAVEQPSLADMSATARTDWENAVRVTGNGTRKRGHLSEAAVSVLQDWLVRNFDDPYPSEEEKARLVSLTGVTLRQINNWMSNARVRIWRPAVEGLHK